MTYEEKIEKVLADYPDLYPGGFNNYELSIKWEEQERAFDLSCDYLRHIPRVKTYSVYSPTSYGLKHDVERLSDLRGKHEYVAQGVVIAALVHLGIPFRRDGRVAQAALSRAARRKVCERLDGKAVMQISVAHHGSSEIVKGKAMLALCQDIELMCGEIRRITPDCVDPCVVPKGDRLTDSARAYCITRFAQLHSQTGMPLEVRFWNTEGSESARL